MLSILFSFLYTLSTSFFFFLFFIFVIESGWKADQVLRIPARKASSNFLSIEGGVKKIIPSNMIGPCKRYIKIYIFLKKFDIPWFAL